MKKIFVLIIAVSLLLCNCSFAIAAEILGGGDGSENHPYIISTVAELKIVNDIPNANYRLANDITLEETFSVASFSGVFDGNNHTIYVKNSGMFVSNSGTIKNLSVEINETGRSERINTGGLADVNNGRIDNCHIKGSISNRYIPPSASGGNYKYSDTTVAVGGIVGYNSGTISNSSYQGNVGYSASGNLGNVYFYPQVGEIFVGGISGLGGNISNSYVNANVSSLCNLYLTSVSSNGNTLGYSCANSYVGGIVGSGSNINACYIKGSVSSDIPSQTTIREEGGYSYAGGLIGSGGGIKNCYAMSDISIDGNTKFGGGLVGSLSGSITNSYSVSKVISSTDGKILPNGGLIGHISDSVVNSYYDSDIYGQMSTYGKSTLAMKMNITYTDWDFDNVWSISSDFNNNYPYLKWQSVPPESVLLNKSTLSLKQNESFDLIATVLPDITTDKSILWTTTDATIATVTNGKVKGIREGTVTITATVADSNVSATCEVTVLAESLPQTPYTVNDIQITDMSGNIITPSINDSSFYVEIDVTKNNPSIAKDMLIVGLYSKTNVLISMTYMKATLSDKQNVIFGGVLSNTSNSEIGEIKGFVWDSVNNMTPLSNVMIYNFRKQNPIVVDEILESAHPYANSIDDTKIFQYDGDCICIDVTFTNETMLDDGYDFIYIYDGNDNEIGKYTGNQLAGKTIEVDGNIVKIRHTSDNRITDYGYKTESIVVYK